MIPGLPDTLGQAKREDIPGSSRYRFKVNGMVVADITVTEVLNYYTTELFVYIQGECFKLNSWAGQREVDAAALLKAQSSLLSYLRSQADAIKVVQGLPPEPATDEPGTLFWDRLLGVSSGEP